MPSSLLFAPTKGVGRVSYGMEEWGISSWTHVLLETPWGAGDWAEPRKSGVCGPRRRDVMGSAIWASAALERGALLARGIHSEQAGHRMRGGSICAAYWNVARVTRAA